MEKQCAADSKPCTLAFRQLSSEDCRQHPRCAPCFEFMYQVAAASNGLTHTGPNPATADTPIESDSQLLPALTITHAHNQNHCHRSRTNVMPSEGLSSQHSRFVQPTPVQVLHQRCQVVGPRDTNKATKDLGVPGGVGPKQAATQRSLLCLSQDNSRHSFRGRMMQHEQVVIFS